MMILSLIHGHKATKKNQTRMEFIEVYTFMICTHLHAHTQQLNHKSKDRKKNEKKRKMENDEGESHLDII